MQRKIRKRFRALFMSKEQVVYLVILLFNCIVYGSLGPTFAMLDIGLGARVYSIQTIVSCIISFISAYVASNVEKKRWIFRHYRAIDLSKTSIFTVIEISFFVAYIVGRYDPAVDWERICRLFFAHDILFKIIRFISEMVIPGIGDVFEQSLYDNQIDYQNHSNAEKLMISLGCLLGAFAAFIVGDFFKRHVWLIFLTIVVDWIGLYGRYQFYFNKKNFSIIVRNFARDSSEWKRKNSEASRSL